MPTYLSHQEDPRIPEGLSVRTLKSGNVSYKQWMLPLQYGHVTLREGNTFLGIVAAPQGKIPEIIRWTEGKDSHLVKQFFYGGVDLLAHDYIHTLLGRGLLPKDEAFVIGFTMGSTNRLATMNKEIFAYIAEHYYPNAYKMDEASRMIYLDAAKLGYLSDCESLDRIDFAPYLDQPIDQVRETIGLFPGILEAYYRDIEGRRHPEDPATSRLLEAKPDHQPWMFKEELAQADSLKAAAQQAKACLVASDQNYSFQTDVFEQTLKSAYEEAVQILKEQNAIARECFEEIRKVCGENEAHVHQDHQQKTWERFFTMAQESVDASREKVQHEMATNYWENECTKLGRRVYTHALLNRGDSPRDRAFCRGFYDGSSNRKSTYAADMKAHLLSKSLMTMDGHYTTDMCQSYQDGVRLGFVSDCQPLQEVDFATLEHLTLKEARKNLNLTVSILEAYRNDIESRRADD